VDTTSKYDIPFLEGDDLAAEADTVSQAQAQRLDDIIATDDQGAFDLRPVSTPGSPGKAGRYYKATDRGQLFRDHGTGWELVGHEPGDIKASARSTPSDGWLLCDGSAVSRGDYDALFNAIGTSFGVGNGSTTFNVPDLRGRVPVGVDGAAARLTANDALGNSGGAEKHQLTEAELASHEHPPRAQNFFYQTGATGMVGFNVSAGTADGYSEDAGGDQPHNNMQPFQIVNYMIRV
jgi:microcystin-dependent protein